MNVAPRTHDDIAFGSGRPGGHLPAMFESLGITIRSLTRRPAFSIGAVSLLTLGTGAANAGAASRSRAKGMRRRTGTSGNEAGTDTSDERPTAADSCG